MSEPFIDNPGVPQTQRRHGLATRLVRAAMEIGRECGAKALWAGNITAPVATPR